MSILNEIIKMMHWLWVYGTFICIQLWNPVFFSKVFLDTIKCYVKTSRCCKQICNYAYENFWVIHISVDAYYSAKYSVVCFIRKQIYNIRTEPSYNQWISICSLTKEPINGEPLYQEPDYKYTETYYNITDCSTMMIEQVLNILLNDIYNKKQLENLVIIKTTDDKYIIERMNTKYDVDRIIKILNHKHKLIKSPFLTIEYLHPKMKTKISIELKEGMCLEGNEILSPLFIKRYLEYQEKSYHFDLDYKVFIMDKNINMFEIGNEEFIKIQDKGYKVTRL